MEKKWWHKSSVYQIYPRSFKDSDGNGIGDIQGIIQKLPYIQKLGCDIIWLCPMYASPQADNGYDIRDYETIDPLFGSMDDMVELLIKSKERDIRIIMDLVVNHTSDEHDWFKEAKKSKNSPFHDFYIWRDQPSELKSNFGGNAWKYVPEVNQYYLHFYSSKQPDLNWENPNMRQAIWDMMNRWVDRGISGFRMDVIDLIGKQPDQGIKENGPYLHTYLQEMHEKVLLNKDLFTVGETWGATVENAHLYSDPNRKELCMIFQFEQIQLDKQFGKQRWDLKTLSLLELKQVLSKWQRALMKDGWNSLFWNNHDLPRIVSRWGNDTIYRIQCAKMFATLLHGMKGTPYIYQGEEIGMTNADYECFDDYKDIETRKIIEERLNNGYDEKEILKSIQKKARDNARTPMQWNSKEQAGFTSGVSWCSVNKNYSYINVENCLKDKSSIFYHYQKLIELRKTLDIFVEGDFKLLYEKDDALFAYERNDGNQTLLVVCNFYEHRKHFCYANDSGEVEILISNYSDTSIHLENITLRPYEAVIYMIHKGE